MRTLKNIFLLLISFILVSCNSGLQNSEDIVENNRNMLDSIGFATASWQMESVMQRIDSLFYKDIADCFQTNNLDEGTSWKAVISPHDDYSYVGPAYPKVLKNVNAKTLIIFGVAHKAKLLGIQDKIVFDSFDNWIEPFGPVKVSPFRNELIKHLDTNFYLVSDSLHKIEHSVEALLPFLQYYNANIDIVPILVPYLQKDKLDKIAKQFSVILKDFAKSNNLKWGDDYAIVISNDAVHYGDEDWGTSELNYYGSDSAGYEKAVQHEKEIIDKCLTGSITDDKIQLFYDFTIDKNDYKKSLWSWCGRYSISMGLLTVLELQKLYNTEVKGVDLGYSTSIDHAHIPVKDIGMGVTAPANIHHWVGYAGIGYK
ncbi:MAG: AmmeMemoRadiSam system protein B [Saprospiraceae bacterium]|nr:AmmeMemoRadiSam system protein B [Saprospiraceae bacterium]